MKAMLNETLVAGWNKGIAARQGGTLKQSAAVRYQQRFRRTDIYLAFCYYLVL